MDNVILVANGHIDDYSKIASLISDDLPLIAVNGGLVHCHTMGKMPILLSGDFDSIPENILKRYQTLPTWPKNNQDQTDLEATITGLIKEGTTKIKVFGALGKRTDHCFYNLLLLSNFPGILTFETETELLFSFHKSLSLEALVGQTLSFFSVGEPAIGITSAGLKWELANQNFNSISNICLEKKISLTVKRGNVVVCLQKVE